MIPKNTFFHSGVINVAIRPVFWLGILIGLIFGSAMATPEAYKVKTVVIDAGHGGKDPGAIGVTKTYEKDITLAVSLRLGALITTHFPNIKVVYTREKDVFVELHDRAAIANRHGADLFISIHCNSSVDKTVAGAEVYCLGLHRTEANLEVAKRENSVILLEENYVEKYDGFDPNAAEAHIIFSLFQYAFLNQSISFASKVDYHFPIIAERRSRGVKQAGFLVLYKTTMPGVLVELGFLSNKEEEAFMKSSEGQQKMAMALFKAFESYIHQAGLNGAATADATPVKSQPTTVDTKPTPVAGTPPQLPPTEKGTVATKPEWEQKLEVANTSAETARPDIHAPTSTTHMEKLPSDNPTFIFKVQFFATKTRIPEHDARLKQVLDWEIETTENGIIRYLSGKFFSLKSAEEQQKILRQIGYADAFIVPYRNGTDRITLKEYIDKYQKP